MRENLTKIMRKLAMFVVAMFVVMGVFAVAEDVSAYVSMSDVKQIGAAKNNITITWDAVEGADGYNVYVKESDYTVKEYAFVGTTTSSTCTIDGLKSGMDYYVKVYALEGTTESGYDILYDAITLPDVVTGLQFSSNLYYNSSSAYFKWDRISSASGYEVTLYDNKNKKVGFTVVSSPYASFSNIKYKRYKVQVRAYTEFNGQKYYSSEATLGFMKQPAIKTGKIKDGKLVLKWSKVTGATEYDIYISKKLTKGYKKVASIKAKKNTYTVKKFKKKSFAKNTDYYVYVVARYGKGKTQIKSFCPTSWRIRLISRY